MRLFESYSAIDSEILEFHSGKELLESNHIKNNHGSILVVGWWKSVTNLPKPIKFKLNPEVGEFRYRTEGVGTFQIHQGEFKLQDKSAMSCSTFSHWNEAGARQRANFTEAEIDEVNWKEFSRLSRKLHHQVRNKMFESKLVKTPILKNANKYLDNGGKLWGLSKVIDVNSSEIHRNS